MEEWFRYACYFERIIRFDALIGGDSVTDRLYAYDLVA